MMDPTEISVKKLHQNAGILPLDLRRKYLQGSISYRMIQINSFNMVENRRTRAANGPLIQTYISHSERVRKSPPNSATDEWNRIPAALRLSENKVSFKSALRKIITKYLNEKWIHIPQFTNDAVENIYLNV